MLILNVWLLKHTKISLKSNGFVFAWIQHKLSKLQLKLSSTVVEYRELPSKLGESFWQSKIELAKLQKIAECQDFMVFISQIRVFISVHKNTILPISMVLKFIGLQKHYNTIYQQQNFTVMSRMFLVLCISSLLLLTNSKVYTTAMTCGACQKTTGCTGNMCLIITGDLSQQYCYDSSVCSFNSTQTIQFGTCNQDISGQSCPTGACMNGGTESMCFSAIGGTCLDLTNINITCSGTTATIDISINGTATPSTSVNYGINCPYTSANLSYNTCQGDSFGASCSCCASATITGITSGMGACIPSSSPLAAIKNALAGPMATLVSGGILVILLAFSL